jgi:hypothetical protein
MLLCVHVPLIAQCHLVPLGIAVTRLLHSLGAQHGSRHILLARASRVAYSTYFGRVSSRLQTQTSLLWWGPGAPAVEHQYGALVSSRE